MGKFRRFTGKAAALALAAAMVFQGTALAAPADELQDILEKQEEAEAASLLSETLGLSELGEAIAENGLNFRIKSGLTEGTAETLDIDEGIPEDAYLSLGLQIDSLQEAWALAAGVGDGEKSILDLTLYGDEGQLAATVPQLFTGALALSAGNLKEQYAQSALAEILGEAENIPDIDMSFYPQDGGLEEASGPFGEMERKIEEKAEDLEAKAQVEKREDGDTVIYDMTIKTEDIMELYSIILKEYISLFDHLGMVISIDEQTTYENEVDEMIEQFGSVLDDELTMEFITRDGLLEGIHYELYCDTTALDEAQEIMTEVVEEELSPAGNAEDAAGAGEEAEPETQPEDLVSLAVAEEASDAEESPLDGEDAISEEGSVVLIGEDGPTAVFSAGVIGGEDGAVDIDIESEEFQGYISYDIIFHNPEDSGEGFSVDMRMKDTDDQETGTFYMDWVRRDEGSVQTYTCFVDVTADGETVYSETPLTASFDAETGDLDALLDLESDDGSRVAVKLDSTFSQIEKGKGFVWTIDGLTLEADGEELGVTSEISVSADPGELPVPENAKDILKMTAEELQGLAQEVQLKALIWAAQFVPEEEAETETDFTM